MSVIILLLIASVSVAAVFLFAFIWSIKNGQYDDEVAPAVRILFDDATIPSQKEINQTPLNHTSTNDNPQLRTSNRIN
jgi:cbb3-type cytochrome oxidase maturation protein